MKKIVFLLLTSSFFVGCAATQMIPGAERVRLTTNEPSQECEFIGDVAGDQGNFISGAWTSNSNMEIGARNAMKNKAAQMGANTVHLLSSRAGNTGSWNRFGGRSQQTNVTMTGSAYDCPTRKAQLKKRRKRVAKSTSKRKSHN